MSFERSILGNVTHTNSETSIKKITLKQMAKICIGLQIPPGMTISQHIPNNIDRSSTYIVQISNVSLEEDLTTDSIIYNCHSCPNNAVRFNRFFLLFY